MTASETAWPNAQQLLDLERQVRRSGTALTAQELQGCWQLQLVWPKGNSRPSAFSGWLFRGLSARLEIDRADDGLRLSNAVALGPFVLRFRGQGCLNGKRPLLQFSFDQVELSFSGRCLLQRRLPAPPPQRLPFFALIHRDANGWLAARGRGGGLALWCLADRPAGVANMEPLAP